MGAQGSRCLSGTGRGAAVSLTGGLRAGLCGYLSLVT